MTRGSSLASAVRLMQWSEAEAGSVAALAARRGAMIAEALERALESRDSALLRCWRNMRPEGRARSLVSPVLCQGLRTGEPRLWGQAILAEFVLHGGGGERLDAWSALGDVWLGEHGPDGTSNLARDGAGRLCGPRLACGIPIDKSLPLAISCPAAGLDEPLAVDPETEREVVARLDRAIALIGSISPAAHRATIAATSNIVLRSEPCPSQAVRGASSAASLGRTVLVVSAGASVEDLAEALVHEAGHMLLSCAELDQPLIGDPSLLQDVTVTSPWTGARLNPQAFLHACAIWAAILAFWKLATERGLALAHAQARIADLARGFRRPLLEQALSPVAAGLSEGGVEMIRMIRQETADYA